MNIQENFDLTGLNTFGVKARAKYFTELENEADIPALFNLKEFKNSPVLFLGGGSNILFTKDWDGLVVLNRLKGIEITKEDSESALVRAMGGEIWHDLVEFAVSRNLWGIENLSYIPGTVGAAPMQNIGAYGAELKNTLYSIETYDINSGQKKIFDPSECNLGYRDSIFKNEARGKYFITAITLKLSKKENKNITYRVLKDYFEKNKVNPETIKDISDAVIAIRKSKLPDPKNLGNAGSFFKNVFVEEKKLKQIKEDFPEVPYFEEDGVYKVPAGWLIEQCGWKGKRVGNVGMHQNQALVLVNYGGANGSEIRDFAESVIVSVENKFGLKIDPEVNFI
jgi:UDP-N-acetylmuramate dehydrogenase